MIVIMVDKSAGNEAVGHMWTETHIYDETITIREILNDLGYNDLEHNIRETIRIQIGEQHI